jgi:hypothetical protein
MKQEELLREFLDLPPEGQAQVVDLIDSLRARSASHLTVGNAAASDLAAEGFIGIWKDREDMRDSGAWVRGLREREWVKQSGGLRDR